ncbi:hypothetical protein C8R44DRAFT_871521 [Mycena epipterygia]|nr:hypothetical protein C8R44DRAFT_871521 [Mycena epipterygia]
MALYFGVFSVTPPPPTGLARVGVKRWLPSATRTSPPPPPLHTPKPVPRLRAHRCPHAPTPVPVSAHLRCPAAHAPRARIHIDNATPHACAHVDNTTRQQRRPCALPRPCSPAFTSTTPPPSPTFTSRTPPPHALSERR